MPADQLDEFNRHIQGKIEVCECFCGERFTGAELRESHDRIQELLDKNRGERLTLEEKDELNQFLTIEHQLRLAKAIAI